jgi:hypothetical protein
MLEESDRECFRHKECPVPCPIPLVADGVCKLEVSQPVRGKPLRGGYTHAYGHLAAIGYSTLVVYTSRVAGSDYVFLLFVYWLFNLADTKLRP